MALEPGTRLGPYEIVELRGKGGMGEVYRARDTRLDRDVAIKVLPAELSEDETYRKRLEREAKTISQLQHPNVCTLHDIGFEGATQYLVMEYLEGETLEDRLRQGPLPVDDLLRIGAEIAEAIDAAHKKGVVHRDLKPGNVMLTDGSVKVLDFGLARDFLSPVDAIDTQAATVPAITLQGQLVGTMPYMAPEQLQGQPTDARTDIWAVGCILYEMTTGERPFGGDTQASLVAAIMSSEPEPPSRKRPSAPDGLAQVVERCLDKDPECRWMSAHEVATELENLRRGTVLPTPRPRWGRMAGAVVIAVAAALATWSWIGSREVETAGPEMPAEELYAPTSIDDAGRLAVLPFDNLTGDPTLDQLALGVPDGVANLMAGTGSVLASSTSFPYKGTPVCRAAEEMGARFVLDGTIVSSSSHVRANAALIDCPTEKRIWAETYEREKGDLLAVQDAFAEQIRQAIGILIWNTYTLTDPGSPFRFINRGTREDNEIALEMARRGAEREPTNVRWVHMMFISHLQRRAQGWADPVAALAEMERFLRRCNEIDPGGCSQFSSYIQRSKGKVEPKDATSVFLLCLKEKTLDVIPKRKTGIPDEVRPMITLTATIDGKEYSRSVWLWGGEARETSAFQRVREALKGVGSSLAK